MKSSGVTVVLTRCDVFCDLLQSTHTEKYLFVLYNKNSNYLLKCFWGTIKESKSADVIWHGFDAICVCPLIDHGQWKWNENAHRSHVIV